MEKESVKNIFSYGFSTKNKSSWGLGLHWCANAINPFGGIIKAESLGKGRGTTIFIKIPELKKGDKSE